MPLRTFGSSSHCNDALHAMQISVFDMPILSRAHTETRPLGSGLLREADKNAGRHVEALSEQAGLPIADLPLAIQNFRGLAFPAQ